MTEAVRITEFAPPAEPTPLQRSYTLADSPLANVGPWFTGRIVTEPDEAAQLVARCERDVRQDQRREQAIARLRSREAWFALSVRLGTTAFSIAGGALVFVIFLAAQGRWSW